jgi:hypothetical protein
VFLDSVFLDSAFLDSAFLDAAFLDAAFLDAILLGAIFSDAGSARAGFFVDAGFVDESDNPAFEGAAVAHIVRFLLSKPGIEDYLPLTGIGRCYYGIKVLQKPLRSLAT